MSGWSGIERAPCVDPRYVHARPCIAATALATGPSPPIFHPLVLFQTDPPAIFLDTKYKHIVPYYCSQIKEAAKSSQGDGTTPVLPRFF